MKAKFTNIKIDIDKNGSIKGSADMSHSEEELKRAKALWHMPTYIRERCDLAVTYAEDGAYRSAARVLSDLAKEIEAREK